MDAGNREMANDQKALITTAEISTQNRYLYELLLEHFRLLLFITRRAL